MIPSINNPFCLSFSDAIISIPLEVSTYLRVSSAEKQRIISISSIGRILVRLANDPNFKFLLSYITKKPSCPENELRFPIKLSLLFLAFCVSDGSKLTESLRNSEKALVTYFAIMIPHFRALFVKPLVSLIHDFEFACKHTDLFINFLSLPAQ